MLTITTNKTEIQGIASGRIIERSLPMTEFWTKRIVNLLGFSDTDRQTILRNLKEGRDGTTQAEREVTFTAGGVTSVRVKVTISTDQKSGIECFILSIKDVLQVRGDLEDAEAGNVQEQDQEVETIGTPTAPAVRILTQRTGFCKYCNQARIVNAPEGASAAAVNEQASFECECDEAQRQRERQAKMEAAGTWAKNIFSKQEGQLQTVLCAIRATFDGSFDYVTIKAGKTTYKIDTDSDGMIRIRSTYRESDEETF